MSDTRTTPTRDSASHAALGPRATRWVLIAVLLSTCLGALDQTVVAAALPTIAGQLHGYGQLSWVITAYVIAAGITTPLYGKLADMIGRRPLLIGALIAFLAGSLWAGAASSMSELIAARALQGIGGGGLMVLALVIIADVVPLSRRGKIMGAYGLVLGTASLAGPIVGGVLTDDLGWQWAFFINLPLGAVALAVVLIALRLPARHVSHRLDIAGFALLSGAIVALTLLTSWAGGRDPWDSPTILALGAATVALLSVFVLVERRAADPLIPLRLFANRTITLAFAVNVLLFTVVNGCATFMPMFLQLVTGRTATDTGLLGVPMMVGLMAASIGSGALISRFQRYSWAPILGCALATVDVLLLARLGHRPNVFVVIAELAVFGLALGFIMQPLTLGVQASAEERDVGAATATTAFAQRIGGAVGLAALGAVFAGRFTAGLAQHLPTGTDTSSLADGSLTPADLHTLPGPVRHGVEQAVRDGTSTVFVISTFIMAAALACALFLHNIHLTDTEVRSELDTLPTSSERTGEQADAGDSTSSLPTRSAVSSSTG